MKFLFLLSPPLLAALLAFLARPCHRTVRWTGAALSLVSLGAALAFARVIVSGGEAPTFGPGELLRIDGLSALLAICVAAVWSLAGFFGPGMGAESGENPAQRRRYHVFVNLFAFAMLLAVSANNVGVLWIALEATTIFSAVLIPLSLTRGSVEASWKYILLSSVGITLAFVGTVLAYFDFVALSGRVENALNWPVLVAAAPRLHPEVMRLAFVFIVVGFGTKAGIAPMHTWLPDAHSEAPPALSAMMSGVLLAVALYAIARWKVVADAALGPAFSGQLLLGLGLFSVAVAAFSLVIQRNYKRMLAYSSIEHTGLICIGLGLGPAGAFAALLHLICHAAAKSMLFLLSGRVLHRYGTTELGGVSGMLQVMPWTGALFLTGVLAIVGLPPFGLFVSEFALIRAGFAAGRPGLMGAVLALLGVGFIAVLRHANRMLYGAFPEGVVAGEGGRWRLAPLFVSVGVLLFLGLMLPPPIEALFRRAAEVVAR
ncbi:MAG TPA: proton-conducting transporter membrane subunit [candidate division Zixibacteria bacterium]|nr:proton-conducting transporter membrane subunit [candidate division Zixibacteria bacterium]